MKKKHQSIKSLGISSETIRKLGAPQLTDVVGGSLGQSNNGCGSFTSMVHTACRACVF